MTFRRFRPSLLTRYARLRMVKTKSAHFNVRVTYHLQWRAVGNGNSVRSMGQSTIQGRRSNRARSIHGIWNGIIVPHKRKSERIRALTNLKSWTNISFQFKVFKLVTRNPRRSNSRTKFAVLDSPMLRAKTDRWPSGTGAALSPIVVYAVAFLLIDSITSYSTIPRVCYAFRIEERLWPLADSYPGETAMRAGSRKAGKPTPPTPLSLRP
jgi:hypothetical protein